MSKETRYDTSAKGKATRLRYQRVKQDFVISVKMHYGCCNPQCVCRGAFLPSYCLDFHHVDRKEKLFNVSTGAHSMENLVKEMAKCTVLCAVCHRLETWGQLDATSLKRCEVAVSNCQEQVRGE